MPRRLTRQPAPIAKPARVDAPRWLRPAILALSVVLWMGRFSTEVADSDTWSHLETGKYIVRKHAIPIPDPFAYTTYLGKPAYRGEAITRDFNLTHSWLGQAFIYTAYAAGGFPGMVLLRAVTISAFCGIMGMLAYRRSNSFYRALAAAFTTAFIASYFTSDRPYQFTYLLLAVTIAILEYRRGLWLLPPLFLLWANTHAGFFMGFVVLGAYCAEALFQRWRGNPPADERRLWLVSAVSVAASGLNPGGFRAIWVLVAYRNSYLTSTLFEWQRPALWPPNMLVFLLAATVAVLVWQRGRARLSDWLLVGLFGAAYLSAVRNTNLVGLIAPLVIVSYLPGKRALPMAAEFLAAILVLAGIAVETVHGRVFQLRAAEWKYPSGAADFLLAHHVTAPMFNSYEKGGYLGWRLWPQQRVFIDGRSLNESVFRDYERIIRYSPSTGGPSGRELLGRYGVQVIVMNGFESNSGDPYVLPLVLAGPQQTEWKLVFQDAAAVIFMRSPPDGVEPLRSSDVMRSLEAQCAVSIVNDPARPRCARGLGRLFVRMGDMARARHWMGIYLERRTDQNPADDLLYRQLTMAR